MINASTSLTLTLHREGNFNLPNYFLDICDSYLLIIKSIADEKPMFDGMFYDIDISII